LSSTLVIKTKPLLVALTVRTECNEQHSQLAMAIAG
jgi:hypothetical protein